MERDPSIDWLVRDIRGHLRKRPKRFQLSDAGAYAHQLYELNTATLPSGELACRAGCGGCCYSHVGVEIPEAFTLLRHLKNTLSAEDFARVMEGVKNTAEKVGGMGAGSRWEAQIPCAFLDLDSESCTVYEARPLACRGYNSLDLDACNTSTETRDHSYPIPADGERMLRSNQLRDALGETAARTVGANQPVEQMELHSALVMAQDAGDELAWMRARKKS